MRRSLDRLLTILLCIFLAIIALYSCGSVRNMYYERYDADTSSHIDSLSRIYDEISIPYEGWEKTSFYGSDSVRTTVYSDAFTIEDSLYIISVTENEGDSLRLLRFRKEVQR